MRILWLSNTPCGVVNRHRQYTFAGGWMISLEEEIKKKTNIDLHVIYISDIEEPPFYYEGTYYYPIYSGRGKSKISKFLFQYRRNDRYDERLVLNHVLKIVKQINPDIIHIHGTEAAWGVVAKEIDDIPVVFSIQGLIAPYSEKYFSGIPQADAFKLDTVYDFLMNIGVRKQWKSFLYRAKREEEYLSIAKYIFGRTFWDRDCTLALNPHRKYYVVNEILRSPFYKKKWKGFISTDTIKIISTISGGIYKGMETVLKCARLLNSYGDIRFEWHIAGYDINSKWVKMAECITNVKAKDANILFHGRVNADILSDLLVESDIYVHVSHIENSPNSVCEAMLVGMPVIASYAGGTSSLLEHEKEGVLYQDGDPYVLAGAILEMVQHTDKAYSYAAAACDRATHRHCKESISDELCNGYYNIIEDYRNGKC